MDSATRLGQNMAAIALAWECRDAEPDLDSFYVRYIERIEQYTTHTPQPGWNGVRVPESK